VLLLPACGSKGTVKSNKASETVLNAETTPSVSDIGMAGENSTTPVKRYIEKIQRKNHAKSTPGSSSTNIIATSSNYVPTPLPTFQTSSASTAAPVKKSGGSHWFLWILVILIFVGIGWYFWSKSQSDEQLSVQPKPPTGGLSPVSGFTGLKKRIENDPETKPSFWTKKIF
jgi:ATP-dependent Zn protease